MLKRIFDSHSHYNDEVFDEDLAQVVNHLRQNGVCGAVNVGYNVDATKKAKELCRRYPGFFWYSAGIHPYDAADAVEGDIERIRALAKEEGCVAIGEIGLDYYRDVCPKSRQKEYFEAQLSLAEELSLPVIIHTRDATQDTLEILSRHAARGVVHCFSGSAETAKELVAMGWYIGFTGVVTFKNAKKPLEAAREVPLDRLLLETDCPYMAPVPYRGKRCTSDMIALTAEKIAGEKGISPQELIDLARKNTCRLFKIPEDALEKEE